MLDSVKKNVIWPMGQRLGTLLAGFLIPYGVHSGTAEMLTTGIIGVGLLAADLLMARFARKRLENE